MSLIVHRIVLLVYTSKKGNKWLVKQVTKTKSKRTNWKNYNDDWLVIRQKDNLVLNIPELNKSDVSLYAANKNKQLIFNAIDNKEA